MTDEPQRGPEELHDMASAAECPCDLSQRRSPYGWGEKLGLVLWWAVRALLFRTSFHTWNGFRSLLLRLFGATIGKRVVIGPTVRITHPWNLTVGDYSQIGDYAWLYAMDRIVIGSHAMVSHRSFLCTAGHDYTVRTMPLTTGPIEVGDGAWVCADVFVGPGVRIGRGAVVGARSGVFTDLPDMMVCTGLPCRPRRPRVVADGQAWGASPGRCGPAQPAHVE